MVLSSTLKASPQGRDIQASSRLRPQGTMSEVHGDKALAAAYVLEVFWITQISVSQASHAWC